MHDEIAWEAERLRHGVMSYGLALDNGDEDLGEKPRIEIRPLGPLGIELTTWKVAPFLTNGRQNPVTFYEAGHFQLSSVHSSFAADYDHPDVRAIEAALTRWRDEQAADVRALAGFLAPGVSLEADIQAFERSASNLD